MYSELMYGHSLVRWLVLISLIYAIYRAYRGYVTKAPFTKTDNAIRHWTATFAHIQLVIGVTLYFQSPVASTLRTHFKEALRLLDTAFFGLLHPVSMLIAIIAITIGSALAKRRPSDSSKFRTMLIWFSAALLLILIAIPWPFSPLAQRPYFR